MDTASGEALSDALAKGLVNTIIDAVSMPGEFFGGGDSETLSEVGMLGEAIAELVNQKRGMAESTGRVALH